MSATRVRSHTDSVAVETTATSRARCIDSGCSVAAAWLFEDEASAETDALLDQLADGAALVRLHWRLELAKARTPRSTFPLRNDSVGRCR